jgi:hypothetical protein
MGGRGSSSGISDSGKQYGTEFDTLLRSGNIKFVSKKEGSATAPLETMKGARRVYATIGSDGEVHTVSFYDGKGKRTKQIDVRGKAHYIDGNPVMPHTHKGYFHDEKGTYKLTAKERRLIEYVLRKWANRTR